MPEPFFIRDSHLEARDPLHDWTLPPLPILFPFSRSANHWRRSSGPLVLLEQRLTLRCSDLVEFPCDTCKGNDLPQPMNLRITDRLLPPWSRPRRNSPGALAPCIKAWPSAGSIGSGILHHFSIGATGSSKSNTTLHKTLSFHIRPGASVKLPAFCSPPATSIHS
ncbi:hypothetical protein EDB19DRAFT_1834909 [Suillus lakei]|nr:hypothetical protein EDB19DRAFT_1834909 [Suillus lakei]